MVQFVRLLGARSIIIKAVVQYAKTNILLTLKFATIFCYKNMVTYPIAKFWTITIS